MLGRGQDEIRVNDKGFVHQRLSVLDGVLSCVQRVYRKSALRDASVANELVIDPCPANREQLSEALASHGIRVFESENFVFLIPAKFFPPRPPDLSPYIKTLAWSKLTIVPTIRSSPEISDGAAQKIEEWVLEHARLVPLELALWTKQESEVKISINVAILIGRVAPNGAKPVVAWINALPTFSTGRIVYGEMRDGILNVLWDSPLFNSMGQVYYKDVNGDGWQEIVIQSQDCGNHCTDAIVIFDRNGRELTRQPVFDRFAEHFDEKDGVSAIKGREIDLEQKADGTSAIVVHEWSRDKRDHVFMLQKGVFVPQRP